MEIQDLAFVYGLHRGMIKWTWLIL